MMLNRNLLFGKSGRLAVEIIQGLKSSRVPVVSAKSCLSAQELTPIYIIDYTQLCFSMLNCLVTRGILFPIAAKVFFCAADNGITMATISGSLPVNGESYTIPTNSAVAGSSANSDLAQLAVSLASDAGVIATLGSNPPARLTYDAAGLFNSLVQAGRNTTAPVAQASSNTNSPASAQQTADQNILSSLSSSSLIPVIYNSSGVIQSK